MSEANSLEDISEFRSFKTKSIPKNKPGFLARYKTILHNDLDKNCLYTFSDSLIRIEYPGYVQNIEKAIETLGGIQQIYMAVEGKKLVLNFNPENFYNKGCVADKETNVGLLIKVIQHIPSQEYSYQILGPTSLNFNFNRMCDFQYLPLIPKTKTENEESEMEYIYDKIITDKIPSLEWFTKNETDGLSAFIISENFARFDVPQLKFKLNSANNFISLLRPDILRSGEYIPKKTKEKQSAVHTLRVSFAKPSPKIPDQPLSKAMESIKIKSLQQHYLLIKSYFQERPIWRKVALMHKTKISADAVKYVLPGVAYYCSSGPWRSCWIRFEYDPTKDYNCRIYQVLDFRIRHSDGMQLKIKAKRASKNLLALFEQGKSASRPVCAKDYTIRPNHLPPARQMFFQYCDIFLPEIQEMLSKLPKLPPTSKCDLKNGWLPLSFQEHCREIINKYIFDAVQQEVLNENQMQMTEEIKDKKSQNVSSYCSKMLNNIRKGVFQSIDEFSVKKDTIQENIIEEIDLSDDDDELEHIDANEVVNSLPERIPENFEDEDESDLEIDMEAVEEVNKIVLGIKDTHLI